MTGIGVVGQRRGEVQPHGHFAGLLGDRGAQHGLGCVEVAFATFGIATVVQQVRPFGERHRQRTAVDAVERRFGDDLLQQGDGTVGVGTAGGVIAELALVLGARAEHAGELVTPPRQLRFGGGQVFVVGA